MQKANPLQTHPMFPPHIILLFTLPALCPSAASPLAVVPDRALRAHHQAAVGEEVEDDGVKVRGRIYRQFAFWLPPPRANL